MPAGISGRDLAEHLFAQSPALKIIYSSGYGPGMAERDIALPEDQNFLPKPYLPTKLLQVVRACLDHHPAGETASTGPVPLQV